MSPILTVQSPPPDVVDALRSVDRTERAQAPTRLGDKNLNLLLERKMIYVCHGDRGRFAHLTRKGALALGVDPGNRR